MQIALDLVELADCTTPEAIVGEILKQNPSIPLPIPLESIASVVGIQEIKFLDSDGFEGMLITNREKSDGIIFVNNNRPARRRRFTIGHELGHYLLPWHRQEKFTCSSEDIQQDGTKQVGSRPSIEVEANQFASELLLPREIFRNQLKSFGEPDINHVMNMAETFDTSMEATLRRYINLSDHPCAVVFSKDGRVRYSLRSSLFPYTLDVKKDSVLPKGAVTTKQVDGLSDWEEVDSIWWISDNSGARKPETILEQTLPQESGYKVTMLYIDDLPDEEDD